MREGLTKQTKDRRRCQPNGDTKADTAFHWRITSGPALANQISCPFADSVHIGYISRKQTGASARMYGSIGMVPRRAQ